MRTLLRVLLGAAALVAACLLLAPASLLDAPLAARTGERLRLADAHGVWWRGHGVLAAQDGSARLRVGWRVALVPLLTGSLVVTLRGDDDAMPTGTLALRNGAIDVRDLHVVVPATILSAAVPALSAVGLRGEIDARAPSFAWRRDSSVGTLDATWQAATIVVGVLPFDLGRVVVNARPANGGVAGAVRNVGGAVAIDGTIDVHDGIAGASFKLAPTPGASSAVRALLALTGRPDDSGAVTLTWRSDRR